MFDNPRPGQSVFGLFYRLRLPIAVLLIGLAGLTLPEQVSDMLSQISWREDRARFLSFHGAVAAWGLCLWLIARWSATLAYGDEWRTSQDPLLAWANTLPRLLVLGACAGDIVLVLRTFPLGDPALWPHIVAAAIIALGLIGFAWRRRRVPRTRILGWVNGDEAWIGCHASGQLIPCERPLWRKAGHGVGADLAAFPFGRYGLPFLAALAAALTVAISVWPVAVPRALGAPACVMFGLAGITLGFGWLVVAGERGLRVRLAGRLVAPPMLTLILAWNIAGGEIARLWPRMHESLPGAHNIRRLPKDTAGAVWGRPTLASAAAGWLARCAPYLARDGRMPVVLVATAGGASRAALWTASALHRAELLSPGFHRHVFAISSVSGGSLGAAVWIAQLADAERDCTSTTPWPEQLQAMRQAVEMLGQDFLAPPLASYLFSDALARFALLPLADRAAALEQGFADSYRDATGGSATLDAPFLSLWRDRNGATALRPLWFANGTHTASGLPAITAPVRIGRDDFPFAHDALSLLGRDVRVATTVTNTARFPYVTPVGRLPNTGQGLVDGGYFENLGGGTLRDVARALRAAHAELPGMPALDLIVLLIQSDPDLPPGWIMRCSGRGNEPLHPPPGAGGAQAVSDFIGPALALASTQGGQSKREAADLAALFCGPDEKLSRFLHVAMCDGIDPRRLLGLNWTLSAHAVQLISETLSGPTACGNDFEFAWLAKLLNAASSGSITVGEHAGR